MSVEPQPPSGAVDPPENVPAPTPAPTPAPVVAPPPIGPGGTLRWFPGGSGFNSVRDLLLFIMGIVIMGHQVFFAPVLNEWLIAAGASLAGLPIVLRTENRKQG